MANDREIDIKEETGDAPSPMGEMTRKRDLTHAYDPGILRSIYLRSGWILADIRDAIAALIGRERDSGGLFHFAPVFLALGISAYFLAGSEPLWFVIAAACLLPFVIARRVELHGRVYFALMALFLFFAGMMAAQLRVKTVEGPVMGPQITLRVAGLVLNRDANSRGNPRYEIKPVSMEGLEPEEFPDRIRISASAGHIPLQPGETISGLARIQPFSGPAFPGGYDFGFFNWLKGFGGTGFFMGAPSRAPEKHPVEARTFMERMEIGQNRIRLAIGARIRAQLNGPEGDLATALITGDRTGIPQEIQESLRRSGLAHILAISGLHMALVTLTVVWALRLLLPLSPQLVLHYPVRKWAALGGFVAATAYLLLSGGAIATQRAWIMISIMLLATLLDRRAVTIRNVVLAALFVLLLTPEAILQPGFQMSFAAAGALVAAYSALNDWRIARYAAGVEKGQQRSVVRTSGLYFGGLAFTSLIAGVATALFAAWHFHRVAPMGFAANLLAMPVVSIAVMPLALISALLIPFGLEGLPLKLLGLAIALVTDISAWINGFDLPSITGTQPVAVLLAGSAGLLLLILLRTRLRVLGLLPLLLLPALIIRPAPPDLVIAQDGRAIGMRDDEDKLALLYPRRNRFITDIWLRAWSGGEKGNRDELIRQCDRDRCIAVSPQGVRVEIVYNPDLLRQACETADILAAPRLRWVRCREREPSLILRRGDFEWLGTHIVRFEHTKQADPSFRVETALGNDNRPWNRARIAALQYDRQGRELEAGDRSAQ